MTSRPYWILVVVLGLAAAGAGAWLAARSAPAPQLESGTWLGRGPPFGPVALNDDTGAPFGPERLRGAPSLVFFGFTHCPDVCPATLAQLARARRESGIAGLRVLFITLDPARDRAAVLAQYLRAFGPGFLGLTGSAASIRRLAAANGIAFERVALPGGDYTIDHVAAVILLDGSGHKVAVFTPPYDAGRLAADLRRAARWLAPAPAAA